MACGRWHKYLMAVLALAAMAHGAGANGCVPVARAAIALGAEHRSLFVPMAINGDRTTFLLDTGAERTILNTDAARRLGLAAHYTYSRTMAGFGGTLATGEVHPDSVSVGSFAMAGFFALVGPVQLPALDGRPADGLLGADVLLGFDLDIDMVNRRLGLYAPLTCAAPTLPWSRPAHGTPAHVSLRRHLVFDVQIGGRTLPAFIDTGAQASFIDTAAAARLGVNEAALRQDPTITVHGVGHSAEGIREHRFDRLDVAGLEWPGPVLVVAPMRLDDADVILGADFLETHRVWLAYQGRRVFISPED